MTKIIMSSLYVVGLAMITVLLAPVLALVWLTVWLQRDPAPPL